MGVTYTVARFRANRKPTNGQSPDKTPPVFVQCVFHLNSFYDRLQSTARAMVAFACLPAISADYRPNTPHVNRIPEVRVRLVDSGVPSKRAINLLRFLFRLFAIRAIHRPTSSPVENPYTRSESMATAIRSNVTVFINIFAYPANGSPSSLHSYLKQRRNTVTS